MLHSNKKYGKKKSFLDGLAEQMAMLERILFGFQVKGNDDWCVPAQFSEAYSFKEGYARVKKDGKYGVLKLISDVSFDGSLLQNRIKVIHGKSDSLKILLIRLFTQKKV